MYLTYAVDTEPKRVENMDEEDAGMLQAVAVHQDTVLVNGGLHFSVNNRVMNRRVMERIFHRPEFENVSRRVCMTLHAPAGNKPAQYLKSQGLAPVRAFNEIIRDGACLGSSDFVLESFSVTRNATSFDGTHYFQEPNVLLAQLLLNALETKNEDRKGGDVADSEDRKGGDVADS